MNEKQFHAFGRKIDSVNRFEEKVVRNQDWVNWGSENNFPETLYDYIDYNPTHNACINAKKGNIKKGILKPIIPLIFNSIKLRHR